MELLNKFNKNHDGYKYYLLDEYDKDIELYQIIKYSKYDDIIKEYSDGKIQSMTMDEVFTDKEFLKVNEIHKMQELNGVFHDIDKLILLERIDPNFTTINDYFYVANDGTIKSISV